MLSPDLQRLSHIRDYCVEIQNTIERYGKDFSIFDLDHDYQRSISFSIMQIGKLSGGLSDDFRRQTSGRIQWGPIKAMRNLFAHNYGHMDRDIIWETATTDIPVLRIFCNEYIGQAQMAKSADQADDLQAEDLEPEL